MQKNSNEKEHVSISLSEIRANFSKAASRAGYAKEPTIVKRYGEPYVAIVPAEWLNEKKRQEK